jgi:hypothetical protein
VTVPSIPFHCIQRKCHRWKPLATVLEKEMNTILENNDLGCKNDTFSELSQSILIKGRFKFEKIVSMKIVFHRGNRTTFKDMNGKIVPKENNPVEKSGPKEWS